MPRIHHTTDCVTRPIAHGPIAFAWRGIAAVAAIVVALVGGAGCQKSLFPPNQPRTQFEAYEIMRQRYVPLEEPDVFGTPRPAVRARLTPER